VDHDVCTPIDGPAQIGGGEGVVDDERDAVLVGEAGVELDVEDVGSGVADSLAEQGLGLWCDRLLHLVGITEVDEGDIDAHAADTDVELGEGAPVERLR
jgi:hypothetical protein